MQDYIWTTFEPLRPVWPLCQGTRTVDQADRVTPGSGPLNPIQHHSALVWQPSIVERTIAKVGARS